MTAFIVIRNFFLNLQANSFKNKSSFFAEKITGRNKYTDIISRPFASYEIQILPIVDRIHHGIIRYFITGKFLCWYNMKFEYLKILKRMIYIIIKNICRNLSIYKIFSQFTQIVSFNSQPVPTRFDLLIIAFQYIQVYVQMPHYRERKMLQDHQLLKNNCERSVQYYLCIALMSYIDNCP